MPSQEVVSIMEMLRESKEASRTKVLTPEGVLEERNHIDDILRDVPISGDIAVEHIKSDDFEGEFYTYNVERGQKLVGKVLLFLHGGGFMNGSVLSRRPLCTNIMQEILIDALSVEYGQWPEAEHPQAIMDAAAGYKWLLNKGYKPEDIYIFGESAGAMLTLTMMLYLKEHGLPLPGRALVFSPVAGQSLDLPSHTERDERDPMISYEGVVPYYANGDVTHPLVTPYNGSFEGFPPMAIHVGSEEVLYDDAVVIYEKCKEVGIDVKIRVWDELFHVFPLFNCPETDEALKEIGAFFRQGV